MPASQRRWHYQVHFRFVVSMIFLNLTPPPDSFFLLIYSPSFRLFYFSKMGKKDKKEGAKEKKADKLKRKPPRSEICECGVFEPDEREAAWSRNDPRRGWVRVGAPPAKKGKKKGADVANHNVNCTYQRAPCGKYPHLQKCAACAEGCSLCEKVFRDCPGPCRPCLFMFKRDTLRSSVTTTLPLGSLASGLFGGSSYLPGVQRSRVAPTYY